MLSAVASASLSKLIWLVIIIFFGIIVKIRRIFVIVAVLILMNLLRGLFASLICLLLLDLLQHGKNLLKKTRCGCRISECIRQILDTKDMGDSNNETFSFVRILKSLLCLQDVQQDLLRHLVLLHISDCCARIVK